jgi:two-component system KDP operon response regulator KdpE
VLLDLGLPDMDGQAVITAIREWSQVPIIVLSVRSMDQEVVTALGMGANDYVTKPFNIEVLLARMRAALRNYAVSETGDVQLCNGTLRIDLMRHEVFLSDTMIAFTPKEYDLLRFFMVNRGKMLTHKEILKSVWGTAHTDDTTYLRVYIGQIREKLGTKTGANSFITTEPGIGYRMETLQPGASKAV